jgi:hypothetical protein
LSLKRAWIACSCMIRLFKKKKKSIDVKSCRWDSGSFWFLFPLVNDLKFLFFFLLFEFGSKSHGCPL